MQTLSAHIIFFVTEVSSAAGICHRTVVSAESKPAACFVPEQVVALRTVFYIIPAPMIANGLPFQVCGKQAEAQQLSSLHIGTIFVFAQACDTRSLMTNML
jgi:hypothetical protein